MKKRVFITIGAIAGVVLLQIIMVWCFDHPAINKHFNLTNKGTLGDAINGMTAPVIALISAAVLFWSFQEQVQANKILTYQWQFENNQRQFEKLLKTLSIFDSLIMYPTKVEMSKENEPGANMIYKMQKNSSEVTHALKEFEVITDEMRDFLYLIGDKNNQHKEHFFVKIKDYFDKNMRDKYHKFYIALNKNTEPSYSQIKIKMGELLHELTVIDVFLNLQLKKRRRKRLKEKKRQKLFGRFYKRERQNIFE